MLENELSEVALHSEKHVRRENDYSSDAQLTPSTGEVARDLTCGRFLFVERKSVERSVSAIEYFYLWQFVL
jgi:hypothetical protein